MTGRSRKPRSPALITQPETSATLPPNRKRQLGLWLRFLETEDERSAARLKRELTRAYLRELRRLREN